MKIVLPVRRATDGTRLIRLRILRVGEVVGEGDSAFVTGWVMQSTAFGRLLERLGLGRSYGICFIAPTLQERYYGGWSVAELRRKARR